MIYNQLRFVINLKKNHMFNLKITLYISATIILISCSSKQEVDKQKNETEYANNDSISRKDSLMLHRADSLMETIRNTFDSKIEQEQKSIDSLKRILNNKSH